GTTTDTVTIQNTAPVAGTVTISPKPASHTSALLATPSGFTDADNDTPNYHYQWARSINNGLTFTDDTNQTSSSYSGTQYRSEEHTSELQSQSNFVCRLGPATKTVTIQNT